MTSPVAAAAPAKTVAAAANESSAVLFNLCRLFHWGPLIAISIISYISIVGFFATLLWWPPLDVLGQVNLCVYLTHIPLILYSYLRALVLGPGFVPLGWRPREREDEMFLQFCAQCEGFKPPRSHHCRKCGRCVMKMDHHCPWINTCCGHLNHFSFVAFLFFVPIGCVHAGAVLCMCAYRTLVRSEYQVRVAQLYRPPFTHSVPFFFATVLGAALAVAVVLCVGFLFVLQLYTVIRNKTGIESFICEKAEGLERSEDSSFVYPYDLGWYQNVVAFLVGGNGIDWPIRPGCSKYDLTVEQKLQKEAKRNRIVQFRVTKPYSGSILPVSMGCRVLCDIPITDESRMQVSVGDVIDVSRGKKHWFYGQKVSSAASHSQENGAGDHKSRTKLKKEKGWFPRSCAQRVPAPAATSLLDQILRSPKKDK